MKATVPEHERQQPGDDDRPAADAVGQAPGAVHAQRRAEPLWRHEQPRVEGREAPPDLEVQREEQQRAEERGPDEEDGGAGRGEAAILEEPHVDHGRRRAPCAQDEGDDEGRAGHHGQQSRDAHRAVRRDLAEAEDHERDAR